ncbi:hypothetical protein [Vallitalea okinawensis]|uniref:hypothetical protein n=1 Tax=Vallitalea okinawensis TaxID=2078660 RepID=UPI000CFD1F04|nr:hypothetical protein [Vallitalea okinawensis]
MWIFSNEPIGKGYKELIDLAAIYCNEFILVKRFEDDLSKNADCLLKHLSGFLVEIKDQEEWPGTRISGGYAKVYYYILNNTTKEIIKKYSKGLYSWRGPLLLEDLCFLKEGRKPWIINIAHEQFSYMNNNTDDEINELKAIKGIELEELDVNQ